MKENNYIKVIKAYDKYRNALSEYKKSIFDNIKIGSSVFFKRGNSNICAKVLNVADTKIFIQNEDTGKKYWVDVYYIVRTIMKGRES